jgi:hypothetical protein
MTENDVRQHVIDRLIKNGWITKAVVVEVSPTRTAFTIDWTPEGIVKMRLLYALYDELGYQGGFISGEFQILCQFSRECIRKHGRSE